MNARNIINELLCNKKISSIIDAISNLSLDDIGDGENRKIGGIKLSATLLSASWSSEKPYSQNITISNINSNSNGIIGLDQSCTEEQRTAASTAKLFVKEQGNGYITVIADGEKPACDIPIAIIMSITTAQSSNNANDYGDIKITARLTAPDGWMICDGSTISRTTYSELFSAIGTTYGEGDGSTTFNIPNLKGKVIVGTDSSDTDFSTIGKTGGEKAHSLTADENGAHTHEISSYIYLDGSYLNINASDVPCMYTTSDSASSGLGTAHNNLQPYIALNYIIYIG